MENSMRRALSDEEANKMLNEILQEDKEEDLNGDNDENDNDSENCTAACAEADPIAEKKSCECMRLAENSSRFSLRVMEAMRWLQNEKDDVLPTSSVEDIVDYIEANYRDDGDLYAQVRIALKQVCSQGFVMELIKNEYHLVGPNATSINQNTCSNNRKDCLLSSPVKALKSRRKSDDKSTSNCTCETPSETDPPANKSRRVSSNNQFRRASRRQQEKRKHDVKESSKQTPECSCSVTLTDENIDECICEDKIHKRDISNRQRPRDVQERVVRRINEEQQTRGAQEPLINTSRRRENNQRTRKTIETDHRITKNDGTNEAVPDNVEDIYRELHDRAESKKREKELKEWIKRCQEECKRQTNRRANRRASNK